jgi:hypothetical protein
MHGNLLQQVGTSDGETHANTGHAIELREGAQNDHVLAVFHEVKRARRVAKVDVGFVNQQDCVFRSIGNRILNVGPRGAGSRGLLGLQM